MNRTEIANETLQVIEQGQYVNAAGTVVPVREQIDACVNATRLYLPDELEALLAEITQRPKPYASTRFALRNETSLEGAQRVVTSGEVAGGTPAPQFQNVMLLNFASARNPGGGFLGGAQAQEESLARSSALYASLTCCKAFYAYHRGERSLLYSDRMIYSPQCPVFRKDNGELLDDAYRVNFITSPAPNAGAIRRNQPDGLALLTATFRGRMAKMLALAAAQNCDALILGAWGCGVFRNSPALVASLFRELLAPGAAFYGRFKFVQFSVYDTQEGMPAYSAFKHEFASLA